MPWSLTRSHSDDPLRLRSGSPGGRSSELGQADISELGPSISSTRSAAATGAVMSSGRLGKLPEQSTRRGHARSGFFGRSPVRGSHACIERTAVFVRNQSQPHDMAFGWGGVHSFTATARRHDKHERTATIVNPWCSSRPGVVVFHATLPTYAMNPFCATTTWEHGVGE